MLFRGMQLRSAHGVPLELLDEVILLVHSAASCSQALHTLDSHVFVVLRSKELSLDRLVSLPSRLFLDVTSGVSSCCVLSWCARFTWRRTSREGKGRSQWKMCSSLFERYGHLSTALDSCSMHSLQAVACTLLARHRTLLGVLRWNFSLSFLLS